MMAVMVERSIHSPVGAMYVVKASEVVDKSKLEDYRCRCVECVELRNLLPHSIPCHTLLLYRPIK